MMEAEREQRIERILRQKQGAFMLIASGTLGSALRGRWGLGESGLLDAILGACLVLGFLLWAVSKRMEWRGRGEERRKNRPARPIE